MKFFVTVGQNAFGATFFAKAVDAIKLAQAAMAEFPQSDVVVWHTNDGNDPFEVWENGLPA